MYQDAWLRSSILSTHVPHHLRATYLDTFDPRTSSPSSYVPRRLRLA
ncbi:MAG: hypothetical protein IJ084_01760 [Prevotella sp.]|nr:hypothetical protein [Prevotella sp.]